MAASSAAAAGPAQSAVDVICLAGPTAAGKTALAVEMARRRPLQIISVDSAQIYRGMDIGTGKPDARTQALAPHRLIDIRDPAESYSAAQFREDAENAIREVREQGDTPLLVGGTMLYFQVLRRGLAALPAADRELRREIEAQAARGRLGGDSSPSRRGGSASGGADSCQRSPAAAARAGSFFANRQNYYQPAQ